jgi:hypothetical protein
MRQLRFIVLLSALVGSIALVGCGGKATPGPVTPTEAVLADTGWPLLTVVTPTVQFRKHEQDPLQAVAPGEAITVPAGGNVIVAPAGHGALEWTGFLTADLLGGTDVLLSLSQASARYVIADQASGTARYTLQGVDEAANVQIKAAWASVVLGQGVADVLVSLVTGADPAVWVAVLDGEAHLARATEGGEGITVKAGQVLAVAETGALSAPMDVDRSAVVAWYNDLAAGKAKGDIALVAFRCSVKAADTALLADPDPEADAAGDALGAGAIVAVVARDETGEWLQVRPVGSSDEGWVQAEDLACIGPVSQVKANEVAASEPTATVARVVPTRIIVVSATPVLTPTPTATPGAGNYKINFWAEDEDVECGRCTVIHWETDNIREVYFEGRGVAGNGSAEVCVSDDTGYTLRVVLRDGSESKHNVKVECHEPKATAVPATPVPATATTEPPTSAPPTATTEPPTSAPPTAPTP